MRSWNFYDANGNQITVGWQGCEFRARKHAQALANDRKQCVEFCEYGHEIEDGEPLTGEIVEPD